MSGVFVRGGLGLLLRMVLGAAGLGGWCCGCRGLALGMVLGLEMGMELWLELELCPVNGWCWVPGWCWCLGGAASGSWSV